MQSSKRWSFCLHAGISWLCPKTPFIIIIIIINPLKSFPRSAFVLLLNPGCWQPSLLHAFANKQPPCSSLPKSCLPNAPPNYPFDTVCLPHHHRGAAFWQTERPGFTSRASGSGFTFCNAAKHSAYNADATLLFSLPGRPFSVN